MFDVVFYWMFGGLFFGLVVTCIMAAPDLLRDYRHYRRAVGIDE